MIIRAKTFRAWLLSNLNKGQLSDIANHGADAGWPGLTHTTDCVKLFDKFGPELWEMLVQEATDNGYENPAQFLAIFRLSDMLGDLDTFKNLVVWYAAERIACEVSGL